MDVGRGTSGHLQTLPNGIVKAACYPVAAYAASRHNRAHVIALGAFLWAAATFLVAVSDTFLQVSHPDRRRTCRLPNFWIW